MIVSSLVLKRISTDVLAAAGLSDADAQQVGHSLIENDLLGHTSHGFMRVPIYVSMIQRGDMDPAGEPFIVRQTATTAILDGGKAMGQIVARTGMNLAMEKAREHDVGIVAMRHCGHTGRIGEYTVQAAQEGFLGMGYGSGPSQGGIVAPYGGTSRLFGTNPMSWAVPAGKYPPVFFDYATSKVAWGKIAAAAAKGQQVPEGWMLDKDGNPTTDPDAVRNGGVMLPFGAHKGYGLSMFVELLTGGLAWARCGAVQGWERDFPTLMMAVNISAFQPLDAFCQMMDELVEAVKSARKAPGVEEIFVPGELEWRSRERLLATGIDVPQSTWDQVVETGRSLGVSVDPSA